MKISGFNVNTDIPVLFAVLLFAEISTIGGASLFPYKFSTSFLKYNARFNGLMKTLLWLTC